MVRATHHRHQEPAAWACLAAHALRTGQLSLATSCYAALDMPHKVHLLRCLSPAGEGSTTGQAARQAVAVALLAGDASAAEAALVRVRGGLGARLCLHLGVTCHRAAVRSWRCKRLPLPVHGRAWMLSPSSTPSWQTQPGR